MHGLGDPIHIFFLLHVFNADQMWPANVEEKTTWIQIFSDLFNQAFLSQICFAITSVNADRSLFLFLKAGYPANQDFYAYFKLPEVCLS